MKVSIITPTADRTRYLQGAYQLLKNQTYSNWEWLVYDTSLRPTTFADPRVKYVHDTGIVSIGEKRNRLVAKATGDVIVHFDDDDYYGPTYLQGVVKRLRNAAFCTLSSWFSYDTKTRQFYYWDTSEKGETRYVLNPLTGTKIREIELGPCEGDQTELNNSGKIGYGFSYAYRKEVLSRCAFPDLDFAEDSKFFESVVAGGYPIHIVPDRKGIAIHVIHDSNTSSEFPQYRVPRFLIEPLVAPFFPYLAEFHEN